MADYNEPLSLNGHLIREEPLTSPDARLSLSLITYYSDNIPVQGYFMHPKTDQTYPGFIYCRGGIRKVGMVKLDRLIPLARRGYAVFAPFYRGLGKGQGRDEFGGADRQDVFAAADMLRRHPSVKNSRVAIIGFSRGSVMALRAAKEYQKTGPIVIWGGVSDLRLTYEERVDLRRMLKRVVGNPRKQPEAYAARSGVCWAERIAPPVLIIHGTDDVQVGVRHAYVLTQALRMARKKVRLQLITGLGHHLPKQQDERVWDMIDRWYRQMTSMTEGRD